MRACWGVSVIAKTNRKSILGTVTPVSIITTTGAFSHPPAKPSISNMLRAPEELFEVHCMSALVERLAGQTLLLTSKKTPNKVLGTVTPVWNVSTTTVASSAFPLESPAPRMMSSLMSVHLGMSELRGLACVKSAAQANASRTTKENPGGYITACNPDRKLDYMLKRPISALPPVGKHKDGQPFA